MPTLVELLRTENRPPSARLKHEVIRFIQGNQTVYSMPLDIIKNLAETADCIRRNSPDRLQNLYEKVHGFCMEGIEKIRHDSNGHSPVELEDFEFSFRAYAGGAAKAEYKLTNDISWAEEWFKNYKKSAELAENIAGRNADSVNSANGNLVKRAAHAYGFAAEAAKVLHEKFKIENLMGKIKYGEDEVPAEIVWAVQWYEYSIKSANLAVKLGGESRNLANYGYRDGARAARVLLKFYREPEYAQAVIDCNRKHLQFGGPHRDRDRTIRRILQESQRMDMFIKTYGKPGGFYNRIFITK